VMTAFKSPSKKGLGPPLPPLNRRFRGELVFEENNLPPGFRTLGINFAVLREFGGSNFAIPVSYGQSLLRP